MQYKTKVVGIGIGFCILLVLVAMEIVSHAVQSQPIIRLVAIEVLLIAFMGYLYWAILCPIWLAEKMIEEKESEFAEFVYPLQRKNNLPDKLHEFFAMIDQIQSQYQTSLLNKQAQYFTLQSQINPHFLYNTLEAIRGEALRQGAVEVAKMTKRLSLFFRYSISQSDNMVTLQRELDNVKNYFSIQQYRFGDRFQLEFHIDEDTLNLVLPKITLQPVVENAICHGLEPKIAGGKINISSYRTKNRLIVKVSDDGIGMSRETLNRIRENLSGRNLVQKKSGEKGTGIAIANVHNRLKLFFGNHFGLDIQSAPQMGTDVELILPIVTAQKIQHHAFWEGLSD